MSSVAVSKVRDSSNGGNEGRSSERVKPQLDESQKKRSRAMFGVLMGTLQKFKEESATVDDKVCPVPCWWWLGMFSN